MKLYTAYRVKIKGYNAILKPTVLLYRKAVSWFLEVILTEWESIQVLSGTRRNNLVEKLTVATGRNPLPKYYFQEADRGFYKMPVYLRRAAIAEALGMASSFMTRKENGAQNPGKPSVGNSMPTLYRDNMYVRTGTYTARIKVYRRNTWDWLDVDLGKSDVDYILHHCSGRKECVPTLKKEEKQWYLVFSFEEKVILKETALPEERVLAVDLGVNNACVCSLLLADGTVLGREFFSLPRENDCLQHTIGRIKKAQQHGARKMPRLWAAAKGINQDIAVKTAAFIMEKALQHDATTIVFEHLDLGKKKRGSKKQKLHLWKARSVQSMVTGKAHRHGIRIRRVNAWGTSRLAFDGSGPIIRGTYLQDGKEKYNYSMCVFATGKQYHCDLNASYNIGARYLVREIIKSLPETVRLDMEAKVPSCTKRSTCTLSTLIHLNAELTA